jgi:hypothetical protein
MGEKGRARVRTRLGRKEVKTRVVCCYRATTTADLSVRAFSLERNLLLLRLDTWEGKGGRAERAFLSAFWW